MKLPQTFKPGERAWIRVACARARLESAASTMRLITLASGRYGPCRQETVDEVRRADRELTEALQAMERLSQ